MMTQRTLLVLAVWRMADIKKSLPDCWKKLNADCHHKSSRRLIFAPDFADLFPDEPD
jgi:hypothetical protein